MNLHQIHIALICVLSFAIVLILALITGMYGFRNIKWAARHPQFAFHWFRFRLPFPHKIAQWCVLAFALPYLTGCATLTPTQGILLTDALTLAKIAGTAAATTYGGPAAGIAASAGLNALGTVMQGQINKRVDVALVEASPGIDGVGSAVASVINSKGNVTQGDVDTIFTAAALAAKGT